MSLATAAAQLGEMLTTAAMDRQQIEALALLPKVQRDARAKQIVKLRVAIDAVTADLRRLRADLAAELRRVQREPRA